MHLPTLQRPGFLNCQAISTDTFRTTPETVRFHWFTYKCKKGDEESDSDSDAARMMMMT